MKIAAVQFDIAWEDKPANFAKIRALLARERPHPGTLVALPEMFATGFSMNVDRVAEPYGGQTEQFLGALAADFQVFLLAGAAMRATDGRARNKALLFGPSGKLLGYYAKMHPFTPGGEAAHYTAGERPVVLECGPCKVAPLVCYDLRFPEIFRQSAASDRPELFVVIANWPDKRVNHWLKLLQARAIENQAYVMGVNRVGSDPYYLYPGRSIIVDYTGEILADAGQSETCLRAQLDLPQLGKYRAGLPFLADIRPLPRPNVAP